RKRLRFDDLVRRRRTGCADVGGWIATDHLFFERSGEEGFKRGQGESHAVARESLRSQVVGEASDVARTDLRQPLIAERGEDVPPHLFVVAPLGLLTDPSRRSARVTRQPLLVVLAEGCSRRRRELSASFL